MRKIIAGARVSTDGVMQGLSGIGKPFNRMLETGYPLAPGA